MTSRTHAAHTTCPGCQEEVYLDELVKGRCPLCGCTLDDADENEEVDDFLERGDFSWLFFNYFLFKQLTEQGASPLRVMQLVSSYEEACIKDPLAQRDTRFALEVPLTGWDRIRPKRCASCRRFFFSGGKKVISGDLSVPGFSVSYHCRSCDEKARGL